MIGLRTIIVALTILFRVDVSYGYLPRILQQQQTLNYRANYSAEFQALRDAFCIGDAPILQVTCFSKNLTILGTSDPTIICSQLPQPIVANGTTYECINTCTSTNCESIYLANTNGRSSDGPFGTISFMCEGNTVNEVDAALTYIGGNNGTCAAATIGASTRNLHIGRLGVSCPVGSTRNYVYDDTYFECDSIQAISFDAAMNPFDLYSCEIGTDCQGEACSVMFTDLYINAYVPKFLDTCVEAIIPITDYPTTSPIPESNALIISARFEASWGNLFDSQEAISTCSTQNPSIILSCENGASIEYVLSTASTTNCTSISENELRCTDIASSIVNQFSSVIYDCSGSRLPSSRVTYESSEAVCVDNAASTFLQHAVTLGMYCNLTPNPIYFYNDLYIECADDSYNFDKPFNLYGNEGIRYMCSTSASFPASSSLANTLVIPEVAIVTDDYWLLNADETCFSIRSVPTTPVSAPVFMPSPVSNPPNSQITAVPVIAPLQFIQTPPPIIISPTKVPTLQTLLPVQQQSIMPILLQPVTQRVIPSTTNNDNSAPIGAIVGGIVGGLVIGLAVLGLILYQKKSVPTDHSQHKPNVLDPHSITRVETTHGQDFSSSNMTGPVASHVVAIERDKQAPSDSLRASLTTPAVVPTTTPLTTPVAVAARPSYEVNYKDQSRTVIGTTPSSMPMVNEEMEILTEPTIPIAAAVAMDVSAVSGGSNQTNKSEPPGRRMEEEA